MLLYFNPAQACETSATDKWKVTWHKRRNYSYNATCLGFVDWAWHVALAGANSLREAA